jgi:hypothetical protein
VLGSISTAKSIAAMFQLSGFGSHFSVAVTPLNWRWYRNKLNDKSVLGGLEIRSEVYELSLGPLLFFCTALRSVREIRKEQN